jgi:hypothetical protein
MPTPWMAPTYALSRFGWRLAVMRSLKHMANSPKTPTVNSSSWRPVAPVMVAIVLRMIARSFGRNDCARCPTRRANPRRIRRGSQPSTAVSR